MAQLIGQGGTITLDGFFRDGTNALVDPDTPQVSILNPDGDTIVLLDTPTRHVSTGFFQYDYTVAGDAMLGAWAIRWYGTINGVGSEGEDGFTVVPAGSISFGAGDSDVCAAWADHTDICLPCLGSDLTNDELDVACLVASDMLFNLTGRRWPGRCSDTIRPLARYRRYDGPPRWWPAPAQYMAAYPWGFCSCNRSRELGCSSIPEIALPGRPVDPASIVVKIDGNDFTEFRLDDHNKLVRLDGQGWPCCQNLLLADTEVGTMSIGYTFGTGPPIGGVKAAASLGCQLAIAYNPAGIPGECKLPKRVQTITRAGTTMALLDPLTLITDGMVGLTEVDLWVASVIFGDQRRRGRLLTPGRRSHVRRTNQ